ncbi:Putative uncharacterized protein [Moritella viscosa]|nr:Putative uncharacterized protein [Moritella viscosa]
MECVTFGLIFLSCLFGSEQSELFEYLGQTFLSCLFGSERALL